MTTQQKAAFEALHQQQGAAVLQLCLGYSKGNTNAAADLAQDVWLTAWRSWENYRQQASAKTWLYRVAVNVCLGAIRRQKSRPNVVTNQLPNASSVDVANYELYEAIGKLPSLDRLVLMLTLDGFQYDEIATITGLSSGALRTRAHRARTQLKTLLHG